MKQQSLFSTNSKNQFGGSLLSGSRKTARPLSIKKPVHLVLKAKNDFLLLRNKTQINQSLHRLCLRFGIKKYSMAVHADHIHMIIRIHNRDLYRKWIRALTSALVGAISGLKFKFRPYTYIMSWGRQFRNALRYLEINRLEGELILFAHDRMENFRSGLIQRIS